MAARTRLLEYQAQPSQKVGVSRTVSGIGVVEHLLCKIERTEASQRLCEVTTQGFGQYGVHVPQQQWMLRTDRIGWLKKLGAVGSHLLKVGRQVRVPLVMEG